MKRAALFLLLAVVAAPSFAERIRAHICIIDGQLTAAQNAVRDSAALDIRGGFADEFSVDAQRAGGGGPGWNCASWVMDRDCMNLGTCDNPNETVSFELFVKDVIEELNMQWNTGAMNVQAVTAIHQDEYPGMSPLEGFNLFLLETVNKPFQIERVPDDGEP